MWPVLFGKFFWNHHQNGDLEILRTIGAQPAISMANLKKYKFQFLLQKTEQSAIALVLSDTDTLIEQINKLIVKKKNIKQGTMQELLSGKVDYQDSKRNGKHNR